MYLRWCTIRRNADERYAKVGMKWKLQPTLLPYCDVFLRETVYLLFVDRIVKKKKKINIA